MPRRTLTPATPAPSGPPVVLPHDLAQLAQSDPTWAANLQLLRRQWKWAAFSQFFYTFAPLLATNDVTLTEVEDDLARGTSLYLPRIMQRLLYTLTQDRKITQDNWQTALRKQYMRRDPDANPIGAEPKQPSRLSTRDLSEPLDDDIKEGSFADTLDDRADGEQSSERGNDIAKSREPSEGGLQEGDVSKEPKSEPKDEVVEESRSVKQEDDVAAPREEEEEEEESKDWTELPMLVKLDSLYLLMEWQFQNPHRLRTIMKDDDEYAQWRIEPIGYDARTNAYWLIGPDRLWLQRVPPKPPKGVKRKRATASRKSNTVASTSKVGEEEYESEVQVSRKRKRAQPQTPRSRPSRAKAKQAPEPMVEQSPGGRGTRAAKLQANKKLDVQAKELAEFQRQAAALASSTKSSSRSTRRTRHQADMPDSPTKSSRRPTFGTRASARLRGTPQRDDDEWQQIPEEWLSENAQPDVRDSKKKGKEKPDETEAEVDAEGDADAEGEDEEPEAELEPAPEPAAEPLKTGLESDGAASELTELSEDGNNEVDESIAEPEPSGRRPRTRQARSTKRGAAKEDTEPPRSEPDLVEELPSEAALTLPEDFVEWEAICITLPEWEHIAERFEKATHYLEKNLYKMLTQNIVPIVTAELREAERKRKLEEAVVHRKRSSRIAIKESEKEEARLAARKKAEEDEKLARARRLETRAKKEEAEREKREHAREQRRLEREERERRARAKEERAARRANDGEDRASTATPAMAGTYSTESIQLSSVTTPTGIQTPNWMLDCEICGKQGLNVDDGLPMVSCGMCNKWQHISCHNLADQRAGRPRRNWDVGQFYCHHCRSKRTNGTTYTGPANHLRHPAPQPYGSWSQSPPVDPALQMQKMASSSYPRDVYAQPTSDVRFLPPQPQPNGSGYGQEGYVRANDAPPTAYTRTQNGLTFSHYQPEQRAFSTTRTQMPQHASPSHGQPAWGNGYPSGESAHPRTPGPMQFVSQQYLHGSGGAYAGRGLTSTYQQHHTPSIPQHQPYGMAQDAPAPVTNSQWGSNSSAYFRANDSAIRSAAESLAYLQGGVNGHGQSQHQPQPNGWHHAGSPSHGQPHHPQANGGPIPMAQNHSVPPLGTVDVGHGNPMGGTPSYQYSS